MADYWFNFRPRLGLPLFSALVVYCKFRIAKLASRNYRVQCRKYFDTLNRLGVTRECDRQMDRQTDSPIEYAALHYAARPKM